MKSRLTLSKMSIMIKNVLTFLAIISTTIYGSSQSEAYTDIYSTLLQQRHVLRTESSKSAQRPSNYIVINGKSTDAIKQLITRCDTIYNRTYKGTQTSAIDGVDRCITATIRAQQTNYGDSPVEKIWDAYLNYKTLNNIVNDQMMDLQEWFEFEDQISTFICSWDAYEVISWRELSDYSPLFNTKKKDELNIEMKQCIEEFLMSTESGFRLDFIIPCDRIGKVIEENLLLFTDHPKSNS